MSKFTFLKALNSPFKPFKLKWYCGKVRIGTPYFYPRRWRNITDEEIKEKALEMFDKQTKAVAANPDAPQISFDKWIERYKGRQIAVPKKLGFDFVGLGWKTKWTDVDYRFEWSPIWSFVFFKWQIAITFVAPEREHYWPCWLYYEYSTDKTKSKDERIAQCRKEFPQIWTSHKPGQEKETIDYYTKILKSKYL